MKIYTSNILLGLIVMILFLIQPGSAQTSDELKSLKKEFEELKETQKAVQKDLQEIKNLLVRYSTTLGLDVIRYQECLDSGRYANVGLPLYYCITTITNYSTRFKFFQLKN